jgi:hypothetical protein
MDTILSMVMSGGHGGEGGLEVCHMGMPCYRWQPHPSSCTNSHVTCSPTLCRRRVCPSDHATSTRSKGRVSLQKPESIRRLNQTTNITPGFYHWLTREKCNMMVAAGKLTETETKPIQPK